MSWAAFWAPNLVQWIVGGAITAVVGAVVGLLTRFLLKRWYDRVVKPWIEAWLADLVGVSAATKAATEAHAAAAAEAVAEVKSTALRLEEANGKLVGWLPEKEHALEYLKEQNSRLVAQLVIQARKHPDDFESPTAPARFPSPYQETADLSEVRTVDFSDFTADIPTFADWTASVDVVTGRHALHPTED